MKELNINTTVEVELTEFGQKIWELYWYPRINKRVQGNKIRIPLWELLRVFGQYFELGMSKNDLPIKDNKIFIEE